MRSAALQVRPGLFPVPDPAPAPLVEVVVPVFNEQGRIRWVLTSGGGGMRFDGRVGAGEIMAVVEEVGTPVEEVSGLYDLQGIAQELRGRNL
jgi:hypothetical protein